MTASKGHSSNMTLRKKSNPFTTGQSSESALCKQRSKPTRTSRGQESSTSQGHALNGVTASWNGHLRIATEQKMYCNDPMQVQQWAADSAAGFVPLEDSFGQDLYSASYGSAPSMARTNPQLPGSFPMSRSPVSHVALQPAAQDFGTAPEIDYNNLYNCSTGTGTGFENIINMQQAPAYGINTDFAASQYQPDAWSYPTPSSDDLVYANYPAVHDTTLEGKGNDACFQPSWPQMSCPSGFDPLSAVGICAPIAMSGSPQSAIDPSVSSSFSQNSFVGPEPDTPVSQAIQERTWSPDQDNGCFQGFSIGEPVHFSATADYANHRGDGLSTLKASRQFQRTPLSSMWAQGDDMNQVYMDPKYPGAAFQRKSSDGEPATAREHPHYQVGPAADGLYHCPFTSSEDCSHRPEKLKCNYDKHLDSHLKPYRCKISACVELQFSSTACLLRHEREAHGMHGHGEKPHLCTFVECDRSVPGNGFPRRWNLFDHMKRVHGHTGQASSSASSSPTPSSASSCHQGVATLAIRKRRPSSPTQVEPLKRTKSTTGTRAPPKVTKAAPVPLSQGKRQSMQKMWLEQKAAIKARLDSLDPNDAGASEQMTADYAVLQTIAMNIRRQEAGQIASA